MIIKKDIVRLILAVIAGIIAAMLLSGVTHELLYLLTDYTTPLKPMFKAGPLWIALLYHSIYAVFGAMITVWTAKDRAKKSSFYFKNQGSYDVGFGNYTFIETRSSLIHHNKSFIGNSSGYAGRCYLLVDS